MNLYETYLLCEETPQSILSFLKRTIFNKNISNKQKLENFGVGQIKNRIFSAKINKDLFLKDHKGNKINKQNFLNQFDNINDILEKTQVHNLVVKYLSYYSENGDII